MPNTTKESKSSEAEESVVVLNKNAMRPVICRMTGLSIRLGPGEKIELPSLCGSSRELRHLVRMGVLKTWKISKGVAKKKTHEVKVIKEIDKSRKEESAEKKLDAEGEISKEEKNKVKKTDKEIKLSTKNQNDDKEKSEKKMSRKKATRNKSKD